LKTYRPEDERVEAFAGSMQWEGSWIATTQEEFAGSDGNSFTDDTCPDDFARSPNTFNVEFKVTSVGGSGGFGAAGAFTYAEESEQLGGMTCEVTTGTYLLDNGDGPAEHADDTHMLVFRSVYSGSHLTRDRTTTARSSRTSRPSPPPSAATSSRPS
jgi:hypothetical protein